MKIAFLVRGCAKKALAGVCIGDIGKACERTFSRMVVTVLAFMGLVGEQQEEDEEEVEIATAAATATATATAPIAALPQLTGVGAILNGYWSGWTV